MFDVNKIREDFPVLKKVIYMDNAATTQTPRPVVEKMCEFFYNYGANYGRGAHRLAIKATEAYEDARETVSSFLNAPYENTVFTKNTTDGINIIANGLGLKPGDHVITTFAEHHSNLIPWLNKKKEGVCISSIPIDSEGYVRVSDIESQINENTKIICIGHISNVFGSVQSIEKIIRLAHKNGISALVDGAQSAGHIPIDIKSLGCDFFSTAGHKGLLGPQGTGVLYIKNPDSIEPSVYGGGMTSESDGSSFTIKQCPEKFEPGTPNLPGIIGLGASVEYIERIGIKNIEMHERRLTEKSLDRLSEMRSFTYYGPEKSKRRGSLISFNIAGLNPETTALLLDKYYNICVRNGYHCSMPGQKQLNIDGSVRVSFALYNKEEEIETLATALEQIVRNY